VNAWNRLFTPNGYFRDVKPTEIGQRSWKCPSPSDIDGLIQAMYRSFGATQCLILRFR